MTFADNLINFYGNLRLELTIGKVEVMNPYQNAEVWDAFVRFCKTFYDDNIQRTFLFGINPGRFGGGLTGIMFTDPVNLAEKCGIPNRFGQRRELSSIFMYEVIDRFGGPAEFYQQFYLTAVCPLGFVMNGKNLNYYDLPELRHQLLPFIKTWITEQYHFGANPRIALCLGRGTNFSILQQLNDEHKWFEKIIELEHPRFIMQYKRKQLNDFLNKFLEALKNCK